MRRDVDRPERITAAALAVIRRHGVGGLTLRAIAAEAQVPLGSLSYHFDGREDIIEAAFDMAMARETSALTEWLDTLPAGTDLAVALSDLVVDVLATDLDGVYANYELCLAAVRRPNLHEKANRWAAHLSQLLAPYMPSAVAEAVAVVYDGIQLRQLTTGSLSGRAFAEEGFRTVLGPHCILGGKRR